MLVNTVIDHVTFMIRSDVDVFVLQASVFFVINLINLGRLYYHELKNYKF